QKEVLEFKKFQQACAKKAEEINNTYKMGTPEFDEQIRPLRDQLRNAEVQMQEKQAKLSQEVNKLQFKVYSDIQESVQAVCQQKGILIVFTKLKTPRKGVTEEMAMVRDADSNIVVWNRPECDITQDVIAVLGQRVGVPKTAPGGALSNLSGNLTPSGPRPQGQPGAAAGSLMNIGAPQQQPQQQLPAGNR
ncbi:MAG: OmpH family outer membrane protein, partial [Planctomycetia bacterium]|nr:OmpH family outer membrane protein [Planctomycetia bacterium]